MLDTNKKEIKNDRYYQIINRNYKQALYLTSKSQHYEHEKIYLDQPRQKSLGQIWQVFKVDHQGSRRPNCYQIVHARSTLVLTSLKDQFFLKRLFQSNQKKQIKLRYGKWLDTQLFYLVPVNEKDLPNVYRFMSYEKTEEPEYIYYDKNILKCDSIKQEDQRGHWELKQSYENQIVNRSCYLENSFSGLVMDVPGGSTHKGCKLIQYHLNNRFNQRFNLYTSGKYYKINNLNSKLFLSVKKNGYEIIQTERCDNDYSQIWHIQYQGKNLFLICSVEKPGYFLGIRDNSVKAEDNIILTNNQICSLWKIIGLIPK